MAEYTGNDHYWVSTSGSWHDTSSWHDGSIPEQGDRVLFLGPPYSDWPLEIGPLYEIDLWQLVSGENYTANWGYDGAPISGISCSSKGSIIIRGSGTHYLEVGVSDESEIDNLIVNSTNFTNALVLSGNAFNLSAVTSLRTRRGRTHLTATHPSIVHLIVNYSFGQQSDVEVQIDDNTTYAGNVIANASIMGGTVNCADVVSTLNVFGGRWTQTGTSSSFIPNLHINGGVVEYLAAGGITGYVRMYNGGTFDSRKNKNKITIAQAAIPNPNVANFLVNSNLHSVTEYLDFTGDGVTV